MGESLKSGGRITRFLLSPWQSAVEPVAAAIAALGLPGSRMLRSHRYPDTQPESRRLDY
jgi:hypothetical protein